MQKISFVVPIYNEEENVNELYRRLKHVAVKDFKDYLRTLPEVSPEMDQGLSNFFMKLQIPRPEIKSTLVIQEAIIPPPNPSVVSILLDIDLYR